jgi:hypothetical protein
VKKTRAGAVFNLGHYSAGIFPDNLFLIDCILLLVIIVVSVPRAGSNINSVAFFSFFHPFFSQLFSA